MFIYRFSGWVNISLSQALTRLDRSSRDYFDNKKHRSIPKTSWDRCWCWIKAFCVYFDVERASQKPTPETKNLVWYIYIYIYRYEIKLSWIKAFCVYVDVERASQKHTPETKNLVSIFKSGIQVSSKDWSIERSKLRRGSRVYFI